MDSVKERLDTLLRWIIVALFALLVVLVVWQVFSRQVVGDPATWTDEGARMAFVWLGLFASALVFGERGHIAVEFLARRLPAPIERGLSVGVQVIVMVFALVICVWGGWSAAQNAWTQELSVLPFTYGQMYLALPVSGALVLFYAVYYAKNLLTGSVPAYGGETAEEDPEVQQGTEADDSVLPDAPSTGGEGGAATDPRKDH